MNINGDSALKFFIPLISMLIGGSITYGVVKTTITSNKENTKLNSSLIRQIDQRLSRMEGALGLKPTPFISPQLGIQNDSN